MTSILEKREHCREVWDEFGLLKSRQACARSGVSKGVGGWRDDPRLAEPFQALKSMERSLVGSILKAMESS